MRNVFNFVSFPVMCYDNFQPKSFCAGRRFFSSTNDKGGDIVKSCRKLFLGKCDRCHKREPMTVKDKFIAT